jgi:hypothetical protein
MEEYFENSTWGALKWYGSLRVLRADFDTNPSEKECFDYICAKLNAGDKDVVA